MINGVAARSLRPKGSANVAGGANYALIWAIYLAASAVFFAVFWKFSGLLGRLPAWLLRTILAALILTPAWPRGGGEVPAPALMVAALDGIGSGPEAAARGLGALVIGVGIATALSIGLLLALKLRRGRSKWHSRHDWRARW